MSQKTTPLYEQQVLGVLYRNLDLLDTDYYKYFISDIGKAIFKGLTTLQEKDLTPSKRSVMLHSVKHFDKLKGNHLDFLEDEYSAKDLLSYVSELKSIKTIDTLQNEKLEDFTVEVSKKKVDLDLLEGKLESMLSDINRLKSGGEEEVVFYDSLAEVEKFEEIIEKRKLGETFPSGDSYLDQFLYNRSLMPEEISTIFALSGSGKSSFVRNLVERRKLKGLPTLDIQLEMSLESALDSKHAIRMKMDRANFTFDNDEEDSELRFDSIDKAIKIEKARAKRYNKYFQLNLDSMSIPELRTYIIKAKKLMGLDKNDYLFISVDLMSQVKEFNTGRGSKADNYEEAMNSLHALVKELHVHIMGVFQPRRESSKVVVNCLEDVYKFKPNTEQLKNSGAIEERSRVIISVFRPMHLLKKYLPDAPELEYMEDVMEVQILKQNNFDISPPFYYLFRPETGTLYQYKDYDPSIEFNIEEEEDDE